MAGRESQPAAPAQARAVTADTSASRDTRRPVTADNHDCRHQSSLPAILRAVRSHVRLRAPRRAPQWSCPRCRPRRSPGPSCPAALQTRAGTPSWPGCAPCAQPGTLSAPGKHGWRQSRRPASGRFARAPSRSAQHFAADTWLQRQISAGDACCGCTAGKHGHLRVST